MASGGRGKSCGCDDGLLYSLGSGRRSESIYHLLPPFTSFCDCPLGQAREAEEIRDWEKRYGRTYPRTVEERRFSVTTRLSQRAPQSRAKGSPSLARDLVALSELHRQGALTDDEFIAAKRRLLES